MSVRWSDFVMKELVVLQFMYMTRPHLKVGERFLDALCTNIKKLSLSEELEISMLALAIKAFGAKLTQRQELCGRALDALDVLFPSS